MPTSIETTPGETRPRAQTWTERLSLDTKEEIKHSIMLQQTILEKALNVFFSVPWQIFFRVFFKVTVKGASNLSSQGPFVICANHSSFLDGPLLFSCLSPAIILNSYFVGYRAYFDHPLLAWAKRLLRLISIDMSLEVTESLQACHYVLKHNKNLCFFPEGRRSLDGAVQPFKKGIGILIAEVKPRVVPVYIKGSFQAWPPYRMLPRPHAITITIGEPMGFDELSSPTPTDTIDIYANIMHNLREKMILLERIANR